ncbi:ATP-dependent helicase (plasmid) [Alkaliphilus sp. B6464]|nr:ATP-dependent helicase [Alkaliphilus sp. B6464]
MDLNMQQRMAVIHTEGPSLILAVPGGGKTTALLSRTANLILNNGIDPENILSVTFSRSSAKDMEDRFNKIFANVIKSDIHFSTIHSFANKVVQEYNKLYHLDYIIIEAQDNNKNRGIEPPITKIKLLKQIYFNYNEEHINDEKLEELSNKIGFAKNMMLKKTEFSNYKWEIDNFEKIYEDYERIKRENGYVDYDDMLSECLRIFKEEPLILNKYRARYQYIQVDEAQDTSKVQHELIKILGEPCNNIFYVADDDQSIYGFRAAFPEFLLNIDKIYPNTKIFRMEQNYRSTNNIVSVCGDFIKTNKERYEKNIFTENEDGELVNVIELKDVEQQLNHIVSTLKKEKDLSRVAILYRNNMSSIGLAEKLYSEGIPFYMKGFNKYFFKHWLVEDIISFMKLAEDNNDIDSFQRIYGKMEGYYISHKMINDIKKDKSNKSIFEKLIDLPYLEDYQKDNMIRLKWNFNILSRKKTEQAIEFIEYDLKYNTQLKKSADEYGYSIENLKSIIANLRLISKSSPTVADFIQKLKDLEQHMENSVFNKNKNAITLTTIHSSKGLEWKEVYMIDLIDGLFPTFSSLELAEKGVKKYIEEERRLFYVGMTRAKEKLTLYKIETKNNEKVEPSQFLKEMDAILHPDKPSNIIGSMLKNKDNGRSQQIRADSNHSKISKSTNTSIGNSSKQNVERIGVNTVIEHKSFGKGVVQFYDGYIVKIKFDDHNTAKTMVLQPCLDRKLIKII